MLAFFNMSPMHVALILVVALIFFGNRLPEVARSIGRAINEFKRGMREVGDEPHEDTPATRDRLTPPSESGRLDSSAAPEKSREPESSSEKTR